MAAGNGFPAIQRRVEPATRTVKMEGWIDGVETQNRLRQGFGNCAGASNRVRTDDLMITNQVLYQLSYAGKWVK